MPMNLMGRLGHIFIALMLAILISCQEEEVRKTGSDIKQSAELAKAAAIKSKGPGAPALWKVADSGTIVYLFGTIHNLPEGADWSTDLIETAFKVSDTLIIETDLSSELAQIALEDYRREHGELPLGETLFEHLDTGDAYRLRTTIRKLGYDPDSVKYQKPWLASISLTQMKMENSGFKSAKGVDLILQDRAVSDGKPIGFLEPLEAQLNIFAQTTFREQINSLVGLSENLSTTQSEMTLVYNEWLDGDIEGLGHLVANAELFRSREHYARLLPHRNQNWARQVRSFMDRGGTYFIAVGTAHLAGPDSLLVMLKEDGLNLERVQ